MGCRVPVIAYASFNHACQHELVLGHGTSQPTRTARTHNLVTAKY